jgi:zinc protease
MDDLKRAPLEAVQAFFDAYYAPNNAVLVIAGDFDPDEALALAKKEFGPIPPRERPTYEPGEFTPREGELRETMDDPNAPLPALLMAYPIPPMRTPDHYALEVLTVILTDGESSRLNQLLVKKKEIAASVTTFTDDRRGPDTFSVWAVVAGGANPREVESTIEKELESIAKKGVPARELEKAKNRLRAHFVFALETNLRRAKELAEHEMYWGDANLLRTALEPYLAVTGDDLRRVAAEYLRTDRKTLLEVRPVNQKEESR